MCNPRCSFLLRNYINEHLIYELLKNLLLFYKRVCRSGCIKFSFEASRGGQMFFFFITTKK